MLDDEILSKVKEGDVIYCTEDPEELENIFIASVYHHKFIGQPLKVVEVENNYDFECEDGQTCEHVFRVCIEDQDWVIPWEFVFRIELSEGVESSFSLSSLGSMAKEEYLSLQVGDVVSLIEDPKLYTRWNEFLKNCWGGLAVITRILKNSSFDVDFFQGQGTVLLSFLEGPLKSSIYHIPYCLLQTSITEKICPTCDGTGLLHYKDECPDCKGQGILCLTTNS